MREDNTVDALSSAAIQKALHLDPVFTEPSDKTVIKKKMSICVCMCKSRAFRASDLPPCEEFLKNCMSVCYSLLQLWILSDSVTPPICSRMMAALFR